jgi:c-di-GMP-binding flagellar brake protein YcgR
MENARIAAREHRRDRRYPLWMTVSLEDVEARTTAGATLVDISSGGALLKVDGTVDPAGEVVLTVPFSGGAEHIRARVVQGEHSWEGTHLHLQFNELDQNDQAALDTFVVRLKTEFTQLQRHLVAGHDRLPVLPLRAKPQASH